MAVRDDGYGGFTVGPSIEMDTGPSCLACYGELVILGTLGRTTHARCRQCGLDQVVDSKLLAE